MDQYKFYDEISDLTKEQVEYIKKRFAKGKK